MGAKPLGRIFKVTDLKSYAVSVIVFTSWNPEDDIIIMFDVRVYMLAYRMMNNLSLYWNIPLFYIILLLTEFNGGLISQYFVIFYVQKKVVYSAL
jgi:hypothetical protein